MPADDRDRPVLRRVLGLGSGLRGGAGRWAAVSSTALGTERLAALRAEARRERRAIDGFLIDTDAAVHRSRAELSAMPLPQGTDWRWRPPLFSTLLDPAARIGPHNGEGLGDSAHLYHDCGLRAMILRQVPNRRATDLARFALRLEVLGFTGGFISIALPLPTDALAGLNRSHIIRLDSQIQIERRIEVFARLNIRNGPNTDCLQAHLGWMQSGRVNAHTSAFDLAETQINPDRLDGAWLDLVLEAPAMNAVVIRDIVLSRHPRADI